jgi:hypothetical protein
MIQALASTGPVCRCGHRGTVRVGYSEDPSVNSATSALLRQCLKCGDTYSYRVADGRLVPLSPRTALALDEMRASGTIPTLTLHEGETCECCNRVPQEGALVFAYAVGGGWAFLCSKGHEFNASANVTPARVRFARHADAEADRMTGQFDAPEDRCALCREEFRPNELASIVPGPRGEGWAHPECFAEAAREDAEREFDERAHHSRHVAAMYGDVVVYDGVLCQCSHELPQARHNCPVHSPEGR